MHRLKFVALIAGFTIYTSCLQAQDLNKIYEYEQDAEYNMVDKQFDKAAECYIKALKVVPKSSNYKFKIGYCYLYTDDKKDLALKYLEEAAEDVSTNYNASSLKETKAPPEALYLLGKIYQIKFQFSKAAEAYSKLKSLLKPNDVLIPMIEQSIINCNNAQSNINDSVYIKLTNLTIINTPEPNVNAVVSGDGKTLAYTTFAKLGNDIFIANKVNDTWTEPKKITTQLGNKYLLTTFLSYDGKDLYLASDDPISSDIYVTTFEKNKWIKPIKFGKPINTKANENYACVTKDGNTIYFTSDRKGTLGGFDIYKSVVNDKGTWGDPVNLGSSINTVFNEAAPILSPDENYLFFSSEGHNSMGGYDIFYVNLTGNPVVVNLGYPANTPDDNIFYSPEKNWNSGYVSTFQKDGKGKRDIYHIDIIPYINLEGKIFAETNDNSSNSFKVSIVDTEKNDTIRNINTSDKSFNSKVIAGNYKVVVKTNNFIPFTGDLSIPADYSSKEIGFDAHLTPIVIEKPKLISEVVTPPVQIAKVEVPKETVKPVVEKPKEVVPEKPREVKKENKPKTKKPKVEKPKEVVIEKPKVEIPEIKISKEENGSTPKIITYSVQLMALKKNIGADYFKNIDKLEITLNPDSIYRYSVGTSESMDQAMATLQKVKELGYTKAFIRINREEPNFTIQLMALKKPVEVTYFANLSGVVLVKGDDEFYRYFYGKYATKDDAKNTLQQVIDAGYKDAFVKRIVKTQ